MKNIFKQFVEWVTLSNQSEFKKAVVLLTAYYTVGVFTLLTIFNLTVYILFTNSFTEYSNEDKEHEYTEELHDEISELKIEEIKDNLLQILLTSDAVILAFTLFLAYISSKRTLAPLEDAYKRQARFVADAAHELRTPLAVLKAGSEVMLRNNRTNDEYKKFIEESKEEVDRLTSLSNDLLFLAKGNLKKDRFLTQVDLSQLFKKHIVLMTPYAISKKVKIEDLVSDDVHIIAHPEDMTRLFVNLLKNAIDYNKIDGKVMVKLTKKGKKVICVIEDEGVGIKDQDLPYIFERFYKADNSRFQNSSSTGLGLSIVKEIADEHGGVINVSTVFGKGTKFEVIFDIA